MELFNLFRLFLIAVVLLFGGTTTRMQEDLQALEGQALENVVAFTKLYGYVRYFYPGDVAAETDWEKFALQHIEAVEGAEDAEALAEVLTDLFTPYAPTLQVYVEGEAPAPLHLTETSAVTQWVRVGVRDMEARTGDITPPERVTIRLEAGELPPTFEYQYTGPEDQMVTLEVNNPAQPYEAELGGGVSARIPIAVYVDEEGTLPRVEAPPALEDEPDTALTSRSARLASIAMIWNHLQHLYSYWKELDAMGIDWEAVLEESLQSAAIAETAQEFHDVVRRMAAHLNDGHTNVVTFSPEVNQNRTYTLPFKWDVVEGALMVVELLPEYQGDIELGDVITSVDGVPTEEFLREIDALTAPVGQAGWYFELMRLAAGAPDSEMTLTIAPFDGGETFTTTVVRDVAIDFEDPTYFHRETRPDTVAYLAEGILYVDLTRMQAESIDRVLPLMAEAEALVFDMRGYPRGYHPVQILKHLSDEPRTTAPFLIPVFTKPDHQDIVYIDATGDWVAPETPRFTDNVAWIINANGNVSYAESVMGIVEGYGIGEIVGTRTTGANGNVANIDLLTGVRVSYTSLRVDKFDGSPLFAVGITPTIEVDRTSEGVAGGRDELLEAAFSAVGGETLAIEPVDVEALELPTVELGEIALIPYETEDFTALVPEDWQETAPGVFVDGSELLVMQRNPMDIDTIEGALQSIRSDFAGVEIEEREAVEVGDVIWSVYALNLPNDIQFLYGLTEVEGDLYAVVMQSSSNVSDALAEAVFMPVIEAFSVK